MAKVRISWRRLLLLPRVILLLIAALLALVGCGATAPTPVREAVALTGAVQVASKNTATSTLLPTATATASATSVPSDTPPPSATPSATPTLAPSATPTEAATATPTPLPLPTLTPSAPDLVLTGTGDSELVITYVGNAGFLIESGDQKIVIDALFKGLRDSQVPDDTRERMEQAQAPFDGVDLVLVTHTHEDHFDPYIVGAHLQSNPHAVLVTTDRGARLIRDTFPDREGLDERVQGLRLATREDRQVDVGGIPLRAIEISHGERADVRNYGFIFEIGGYKLFHTGDIGGIGYLKDQDYAAEEIDFALVPWFFLGDPQYLAALESNLPARHYIPMHFYYTGSRLEDIYRDVEANYPDALLFKEEMQKLVVEPGGTAAMPAAPGYVPLFEPSSCLFQYPENQYEAECGYLVVPEDRSQPDGRQVKLHVAIFHSTSPNPAPDPVIYVAGGGGANQLISALFYLQNGGDEILKTRDYIMYNQRGAQLNDPYLQCNGATWFEWGVAQETGSQAERDARRVDFYLACQQELKERGINLEMYNSAVNAADLNDLRLALGYDQVNLYGTSYGTKLILTAMRDHPEGIRAVILDSVFPLQVGYFTELTPNINRAFHEVFASCAADEGCNERYPDLEETFYRVYEELDAEPRLVEVEDRELKVIGSMFSDAIVMQLYSPRTIHLVPSFIDLAGQGDFSVLGQTFAALLSHDSMGWGVHFSMDCREEVPFESYDEALALAAEYRAADSLTPDFIFPLCDGWDSGVAEPIENQPVTSQVPALVLAGQFDPATPPAWGRLAAETLGNSFFYEFPGLGHGIMRASDCGLEIGLQFLDDPTSEPDASCLEQLAAPAFR